MGRWVCSLQDKRPHGRVSGIAFPASRISVIIEFVFGLFVCLVLRFITVFGCVLDGDRLSFVRPWQVYDISTFMDDHPGGDDVLLQAAGLVYTESWSFSDLL